MNSFEESVFINCPFDEDYESILQALIFCLIRFGLCPRLATERDNAGESRLHKITSLIKASKYSIHDLSRSSAKAAGEKQRMNMPFELGLDFGCMQYGGRRFSDKRILVMEESKHDYDIAISDLSGSDIATHNGDYVVAIRKVRNWLVTQGFDANLAASRIVADYEDFQEWYYEKREELGFSEDDILDYSTIELLAAMNEWQNLGRPI